MAGKHGRRIILWIMLLVLTGIVAATAEPGFASAEQPGIGNLKWSWELDNSGLMGLSSPATDGESFFFTSSTTAGAPSLYRLDGNGKQTGKVDFPDARKTYNTVAPTIAGERILVPLDDVDKSHGPQIAVVDRNTMEEVQRITYADYTDYEEYHGEAKAEPYGFQSNVRIAWDAEQNAAYVASWKQNKNVNTHGTYVKISLDDGTVTKLVDDEAGFYWAGAAIGDRYVVFGSNSRPSDGSHASGATDATGDAVVYAYDRASTAENPVLLSKKLEGSGSICADAVWDGMYYYLMSKSGTLYRVSIADGDMEVKQWKAFGDNGSSTCTPVVSDGKIYVGGMANDRGNVVVLDAAYGRRLVSYGAPADVKKILVAGEQIYCVYNKEPGGIYNVTEQRDYFVPPKKMQQYCISTILMDYSGVMYYVNDSYHFMAVEPYAFAPMAAPTVKKVSGSKKDPKVKVSWKAVSGADGYQVSQAKKATGKKIVAKAVKGKSVKVKAKKKVKYYYKVRAYKTVGKKTYYGPWSDAKMYKLK